MVEIPIEVLQVVEMTVEVDYWTVVEMTVERTVDYWTVVEMTVEKTIEMTVAPAVAPRVSFRHTWHIHSDNHRRDPVYMIFEPRWGNSLHPLSHPYFCNKLNWVNMLQPVVKIT